MVGDKTLKALEAIGGVTLSDIDKAITEVEAQIASAIGPLEKQLVSLKALRRFVDIRENGKPERKPRKVIGKKSSGFDEAKPIQGTLATQITACLEASGPQKVNSLAASLGRSYGSVYATLQKMSGVRQIQPSGEYTLKN